MAEFRMPSLGADMEAGTLVEWYVKPGARVTHGDVVADVETDKGVIEVEIFEDGVVEQIMAQPGTKVPVGAVLALIRSDTALEAAQGPAPMPVVSPPPATQPAMPPPPSISAGERVRVSPLARRLAAELGVDLSTIQGTGPHGAIERADVERAAAAQKPAAPLPTPPAAPSPPASSGPVPATPATVDYQAGMRRAIAAAMSVANREIPHYYLETRIDMSRALKWLEDENQKRPMAKRLLSAVLLIKAVALALVDVPELNGFWQDGRHQPQEAVHIGFAISLRQGGLVTPAIHHADLKSLDELMEAMRDLITRVRSGRMRSSEMADATITVTNLGDMGVETVYGVIYPPQVALVGFGKILEQPWAEHGMLGIRPVLTATLAADHRATDGHIGARFLEALNRHLQEVEGL